MGLFRAENKFCPNFFKNIKFSINQRILSGTI